MFKRIDGFIIGLVAMILLAWFFPQSGIYEGRFSLDIITDAGISFIFFFYGLRLSPDQMRKGLTNYRLHIVVQLSTFIFFPLLVIAFRPFIKTEEARMIWLAIFFMAALPSTVSSSVVMVMMAKGNVTGAIFNASLSGLIGIVVTPLWMGLFLTVDDAGPDLSQIIQGLVTKILIPVVLGLILHRFLGKIANRYSRLLGLFDKTVILLIVYKSFSKSFASDLFSKIGLSNMVLIGISVPVLFMVVYLLIGLITGFLRFNREDSIAAIFSGSTKSLIHGTVFSKVLLENVAGHSLFLIPIMIYHAMQLVVLSFIAQKMEKKEGS